MGVKATVPPSDDAMVFNTLDQARSLRRPEAVASRNQLLDQPHIRDLTQYVSALRRAHPDIVFPDFDPLDGGTGADMLFLLEKPGRRVLPAANGSGFVSRDNDNATAAAIFGFMRAAELPRRRTVVWNVVPGWNGTVKVTRAEVVAGIEALGRLLPLLPQLRTAVLVGRRAQRAAALVRAHGLAVFESAHPSPNVRAAQPEHWRAIPRIWAAASQARPDGCA